LTICPNGAKDSGVSSSAARLTTRRGGASAVDDARGDARRSRRRRRRHRAATETRGPTNADVDADAIAARRCFEELAEARTASASALVRLRSCAARGEE
jgi:hypothetical protein